MTEPYGRRLCVSMPGHARAGFALPRAARAWLYSPPMPQVFLAPYGPLLLLVHALCAVVLGGSSVHHAVLAVRVLQRRPVRVRLLRLYALVALIFYVLTSASGALLYPRYRYFVRGLYLDRCAPWASNLFDFKENLATLGVPLAVGALVLSRGLRGPRLRAGQLEPRALYGLVALGTALVSLINLIAGLICTGVHGV